MVSTRATSSTDASDDDTTVAAPPAPSRTSRNPTPSREPPDRDRTAPPPRNHPYRTRTSFSTTERERSTERPRPSSDRARTTAATEQRRQTPVRRTPRRPPSGRGHRDVSVSPRPRRTTQPRGTSSSSSLSPHPSSPFPLRAGSPPRRPARTTQDPTQPFLVDPSDDDPPGPRQAHDLGHDEDRGRAEVGTTAGSPPPHEGALPVAEGAAPAGTSPRAPSPAVPTETPAERLVMWGGDSPPPIPMGGRHHPSPTEGGTRHPSPPTGEVARGALPPEGAPMGTGPTAARSTAPRTTTRTRSPSVAPPPPPPRPTGPPTLLRCTTQGIGVLRTPQQRSQT